VEAFDIGEDLQMRSNNWKDDFQNWQHSWKMQRGVAISTESGNRDGAI